MNISLHRYDITQHPVDAIVNAANHKLAGGGGVDGAIHRAGGPAIARACREIRERAGGCPTGEAVVTTAGDLPAKVLIHTVGPVWAGGTADEEVLLAACYRNSLELADRERARTVAFPNISTGVYGFPKRAAARIAVATVRGFTGTAVREVRFVCFDEENYHIYQSLLEEA